MQNMPAKKPNNPQRANKVKTLTSYSKCLQIQAACGGDHVTSVELLFEKDHFQQSQNCLAQIVTWRILRKLLNNEDREQRCSSEKQGKWMLC